MDFLDYLPDWLANILKFLIVLLFSAIIKVGSDALTYYLDPILDKSINFLLSFAVQVLIFVIVTVFFMSLADIICEAKNNGASVSIAFLIFLIELFVPSIFSLINGEIVNYWNEIPFKTVVLDTIVNGIVMVFKDLKIITGGWKLLVGLFEFIFVATIPSICYRIRNEIKFP